MKRIIVSVTNDLVTDQRVFKVCKTLNELGFDILLIGRELPNSLIIFRPYQTFRFHLFFNKGFLFYAEYNMRLFLKLLFTKKDILLAIDLDTLLPNFIISKIFNKELIYDSHELFTEVPELINRPFIQTIWRKIEEFTLPKIKNCITVSDSIATYYDNKYSHKFKVIRNVPVYKNISSSKKTTLNTKIIIYQGALNVGRGIELLINSMAYLENVQLQIIGSGDIENELKTLTKQLNLSNKVVFLGKIIPEELQYITPNADLGVSLEEDLGLSYRYCLPNKIFDYIQAEIPILIADLPEMNAIVKNYQVGEILVERNPKSLALQIKTLLKKDENHFRKNLEIAKKELIWEKESEKLIEIFKNLD